MVQFNGLDVSVVDVIGWDFRSRAKVQEVPIRIRIPQVRMMRRAVWWRDLDQVRRGRMRMLAGERMAQRAKMSRLRIWPPVVGRGRARIRIA